MEAAKIDSDSHPGLFEREAKGKTRRQSGGKS
jgi:hypothetical protein